MGEPHKRHTTIEINVKVTVTVTVTVTDQLSETNVMEV